jgi:hypothetical protein
VEGALDFGKGERRGKADRVTGERRRIEGLTEALLFGVEPSDHECLLVIMRKNINKALRVVKDSFLDFWQSKKMPLDWESSVTCE